MKANSTSYTTWMKKVYETALNREESVSYYNWMYEDGVLLKGMEYAGQLMKDDRYLPFTKAYVDTFVTEDGRIPFVERRPASVDCLNNGKNIFTVYHWTGEERYRKALLYLWERIRSHPRLDGCGGFAHKKVYANQMWLDGLFMLQPLYAEFAKEWESLNTAPASDICCDSDACYKDIANQFSLITKFAYDKEKGLYYHAYDHSKSMFWANPETGCSPNFWGRAMGWLSMAALDVLDYFPEDGAYREPILDTIKKIAAGIIRYQSPSGVWYQVLDAADREGNYKESSCSCMFAYFLKKGVQKGYLPESYLPYAQKAMDGIFKEFVTEENGFVNISSVCQVAGLGPAKKPERDGSYEYYISEPVVANDNKAFGPLLCTLALYAASE